jgi:hypothetical protein
MVLLLEPEALMTLSTWKNAIRQCPTSGQDEDVKVGV